MIQVRGARATCIKNWSIDKLYNKVVVLFSDFIPWYKWRQGLTTIVFHALKWPDFQAPHQSKVDGCQAKKIPKHLRVCQDSRKLQSVLIKQTCLVPRMNNWGCKEKTALLHPQCGNFIDFLSLRFYVKLILGILEVQNLPFLSF